VKPRTCGLIVILALGMACRELAIQENQPSHLEARWTGPDSGKISATATAEWCHLRRMLEIRAVQGDTGLALALYPAETLAAGKYRVVDPAKADSVPPAAGVALRWFSQTSIQGLQGDSGIVVLERSRSGELSGSLNAKGHSVVDGRRVSVTGKFRSLTVRPQSRGCSSDTTAVQDTEPPDTGVN
jgi:hypothetical protein